MLEYDPATSLRHWPMPMSRFGLNPYNENLYRIVFSTSRKHLVCGEWRNGENRAKWVTRYRSIVDLWIMERWLNPQEYTKMSRERWEREMLVLGPWPARGEYEWCHTFELSTPSDANIEKLVMWIEEGRKRSFQDHHDACSEQYAQEERDVENMQDAAFRDKQSAFGGSPMSGFAGGRNTKTRDFRISADQLGLPTGQGKMVNTKRSLPCQPSQ